MVRVDVVLGRQVFADLLAGTLYGFGGSLVAEAFHHSRDERAALRDDLAQELAADQVHRCVDDTGVLAGFLCGFGHDLGACCFRRVAILQ
ncbi:hypothetical protein D3C72_2111000 [compost metagenome]